MMNTVRLFRQRNFAWMTIADAVSVLGDQMGWVALLWFAMVATGHSTIMGGLALAFGLPGVLLGPMVGNILDQMSQKRVLVAANVLLGLVFTAIPWLYSLHALATWTLLVLVIAAGCLTPFTSVGWMVMVPRLVSDAELPAANAVVETVWNGASLLGPVLGGLLIAKWGATFAVLADGVSFWLAALCVSLIRVPGAESSETAGPAPTRVSFWRDTWAGMKALYELKPVWWITLAALGFNFAYGQLEVSLPLFTHKELAQSAVVLGSFWATYFVSSLLGGACSGTLAAGRRKGLVMVVMAIGWGASFLPVAAHPSLWLMYAALTVAGLLFGGYPPLARTAVQQRVPREMQGRIFGIRGSIIALGVPAGSYASGLFGQWLTPSSVIGLTGGLVVVLGLWLWSRRSFRDI